jgi:hypothetical protein
MATGAYFHSIRLSFSQLKMQSRFLDRDFAKTLNPITQKFFRRAGGAIRTTARRMLRKAPQKQIGELNRFERANYDTARQLYQDGKTTVKPRRPDRTSLPGKPPMLHVTWDSGTSPLRHRLWFALTEDKTSVLIGPAAIGKKRTQVRQGGMSSLRQLERVHPFMEPAYTIIEPRLPDYLKAAAG